MSTVAYLAECRVDGAPGVAPEAGGRRLFASWPGTACSPAERSPTRFPFRPLPAWCSLPRTPNDPKVMGVGSVAGHLRLFGDTAALNASYVEIDIDPPADIRADPRTALSPERAVTRPGRLYAISKAVGIADPVTRAFLDGSDPSALDLRALNQKRRRALFAAAGDEPELAGVHRFAEFGRLAVSIGGADEEVRVGLDALPGEALPCLTIHAQLTSPGGGCAPLLGVLEHLVAHAWLVSAVEFLRVQISSEGPSHDLHDARRLAAAWSFDEGIPEGTEDIALDADRALRLTERWRAVAPSAPRPRPVVNVVEGEVADA